MLADGFKKRPTRQRTHLLMRERDLCEGWPSVKILQIMILCLCVCLSADISSERGGTWDGRLLCLCDSGAIFLFVHDRPVPGRPVLYSSSILCGPLLFSVVFSPPFPSHRGSVWLLPVISLLLTKTVSLVRACLSIWCGRGFVGRGTKKQTIVTQDRCCVCVIAV